MKQLFQGIYGVYAAGGDFATNTTGLYLAEAPQDTAYPYANFFLVTSPVEHYFAGLDIEAPLVQFNLFDENASASNIGDLYDDLTAMFDDAAISVTGYGRVKFAREAHTLMRHAEDNVWQYRVDYECILTKS